MKKLSMMFLGLLIVGVTTMESNARPQYQTALMKQIDDPSIKELQTAIGKLGKTSKQCGYCHGTKKSELTEFGAKMGLSLLEKGYVTKDEEKPNEYVYNKTKWTKDADGKYSKEALEVIKASIQAAISD